MKQPYKVLVIYGGTSTEREISLLSGQAVAEGLEEAGYEVERFDLCKDNLTDLSHCHPDVVFPVLHGKGGEDGTIQGYLELLGLPYVGSKVAGSAICIDKILTKRMLRGANLPTAPFVVCKPSEILNGGGKSNDVIVPPCVVKASRQGSSIGTVIVKHEADLSKSLQEVAKYGDDILIEKFLAGMEISVPVMRIDQQVRALPIIEIIPASAYYDYHAKYTAGQSQHVIPARLSETTRKQVEEYAVKAYDVCQCDGVARIDFIVENEIPYILEINTIPGMTLFSLVPDSAKVAGYGFPQLVDLLVKTALPVGGRP